MAKEKKAPDFVATFINERVSQPVKRVTTIKDESGADVEHVKELKRRETNFDNLFALAKANGIETDAMVPELDVVNGKGRVVMMVSNSLRARARKRLGLFDAEGNWHETPDDFRAVHGTEATETPEGVKIKREKPAAASTAEGNPGSVPVSDADAETESAE